MIALFAGGLAFGLLSIWARGRMERREREAINARFVERRAVDAMAMMFRLKSERVTELEVVEAENKDLRKQLGMSPMRRPAFQPEPEVAKPKLPPSPRFSGLAQYRPKRAVGRFGSTFESTASARPPGPWPMRAVAGFGYSSSASYQRGRSEAVDRWLEDRVDASLAKLGCPVADGPEAVDKWLEGRVDDRLAKLGCPVADGPEAIDKWLEERIDSRLAEMGAPAR